MTNTLEDMTPEEQRWAKALVGRDNLDRLQNAKDGRRVRLAPVRVYYEYFEVRDTIYPPDRFKIFRVENGRQTEHDWDAWRTSFKDELAALRKRGFAVREMRLGDYAGRPEKPVSGKRAMLDRLATFQMRR